MTLTATTTGKSASQTVARAETELQRIDLYLSTGASTFNISGYKINDTNSNGVWGAGESGIQNWNITLRNATTGAVIASNLTNAAGFYQFQNLAQGSYNVSEEDKAGWNHTNATFRVVNLTQNITNLNISLKVTKNGDVNEDGVVDIADAMWLAKNLAGIPGFPINALASDVNGDGIIDIADAMYNSET